MTKASHVEIHVSPPLDQNRAGSYTARIAVKTAQLVFPDQGWFDFVDILLWWSDAVLSDNDGVLRFMDGPYEIEMERATDPSDFVTLSFARRTSVGIVVLNTARVSADQLRLALANACSETALLLAEAGAKKEADRFSATAARLLALPLQ
jgi:hypothetical protein